MVGTPTLRHGNGENNFVQKGNPLGWQYGSDGREFSFGFEMLDLHKLIIEIEFSRVLYGTESIIHRPYEPYKDYIKGKFPSGDISEFFIISNLIQWRINTNYEVKISSKVTKTSGTKIQSSLNFQLNFNLPTF